MKESRIGLVTEDFEVEKLKDHITNNDSGDWGSEPTEDNIGVLRSTNFNNNGFYSIDDIAYRTLSETKKQEKLLFENDILIERSGGSNVQPVGRLIFMDDKISRQSLVFSNFVQRISIDQSTFNAKYVYYVLQQMYEMGITESMQFQTTGIRNLDYKYYLKSKLPKPPKPEQQAIAGILTKVDDAIKATHQSIKATQKLKKALMQNLLTGKMKPDGTFRKENEFYEDGRLGKIPNGWIAKKGWRITYKITKGQSPKWQGFEYTNEGVLFVTSENVRDGFLDISKPKYLPLKFNKKIKNSQLKVNDILVNIVGASIGRTCVFKEPNVIANTNQAVCIIRLKADYNVEYFSNYIQLPKTQHRLLSNSVETARANLSLGDFRHHKFIFPEDKDEQDSIAAKITSIQKIVKKKKTKIEALVKLKKSLMQNLLTGKRRVDVAKVNQLLNK